MKRITYRGVDLYVCTKREWETRWKPRDFMNVLIEWHNGLVAVGYSLDSVEIIKLANMEGEVFDHALPQPWVDEQQRLHERSHPGERFPFWNYVWHYPPKSLFGKPCNVWAIVQCKDVANDIMELALEAASVEES